MSNRDYIAWSLLAASLVVLIGFVVGRVGKHYHWAERSYAARAQRLQAQLSNRMARGSDRYFEELRSIEVAIEDHAAARPAGEQRFPALHIVLSIAFAIFFGLLVVGWAVAPLLGLTVPAWSDRIGLYCMPIVGLQNILLSYQRGTSGPGKTRVMGVLILVLGILIVGGDLWKRA